MAKKEAPATSRATERLADFSAQLRYEAVPAEAITMVKRILLDSLGTALAATTLGAGCREVMEVARSLGGKPESTILGSPDKMSAPNAAFANGALAHALNYDALGHEVGHMGVATLTAPLAVAESVGPVPGKRFLAAAVVAAEINARVTAAQHRTGKLPSDRFLAGQLFGYFGAAAGAGRLLDLDAARMHSALGLALMQVSGTMQVVHGGDPPAKAIYGAWPNHGGVLAALLAKAGLGAQIDALEGVSGLYAMIYGNEYEAGLLTDGLGEKFLLMQTEFKPWPTSGHVHPFIEAASQLVREGLEPSDIAAVKVSGRNELGPWCEPLAQRRRPHNAAAAGNSIPFAVAKALAHGDVTLGDFGAQGIADEAALAIADRVTYALDDRIEGGIVAVTTRDGRSLEAHVRVPLGNHRRPLPYERLVAKFRDCCRYAANPLPQGRVDEMVEFIEGLEQAQDAGRIAALAAGG